MKGIETICFQLISFAGSAKSCYMEALQAAQESKFDEAEKLMKEGLSLFQQGHRVHATLIQQEANEEKIDIRLLLMHAEDQMMSAETIQNLAEQIITLYKRLDEKGV